MGKEKRIISKNTVYSGVTMNEYVVVYKGDYTDEELIGLFDAPFGGHVKKLPHTHEGYSAAKVSAYTD